MEVNERIFKLLEDQKKTAKELAEYIGVKPSSISSWKNENSYPSSKYILKISEFLNVSPTFLFLGEELESDNNCDDYEQHLIELMKELGSSEKKEILDFILFKRKQQLKNSVSRSYISGNTA